MLYDLRQDKIELKFNYFRYWKSLAMVEDTTVAFPFIGF